MTYAEQDTFFSGVPQVRNVDKDFDGVVDLPHGEEAFEPGVWQFVPVVGERVFGHDEPGVLVVFDAPRARLQRSEDDERVVLRSTNNSNL